MGALEAWSLPAAVLANVVQVTGNDVNMTGGFGEDLEIVYMAASPRVMLLASGAHPSALAHPGWHGICAVVTLFAGAWR